MKRQNSNKSPPTTPEETEVESGLDQKAASQGAQTDSGGDDSAKENKENASDSDQSGKSKRKGTVVSQNFISLKQLVGTTDRAECIVKSCKRFRRRRRRRRCGDDTFLPLAEFGSRDQAAVSRGI